MDQDLPPPSGDTPPQFPLAPIPYPHDDTHLLEPLLEGRYEEGKLVLVRKIKRRDLLVGGSALVTGGIAGGSLVTLTPKLLDLVGLQKFRSSLPGCSDNMDDRTTSKQVELSYSDDLDSWGIYGYNPKLVDLSTKHPDVGTPLDPQWIDPPAPGLDRVYGVLHFGDDTNINIVLDGINTSTPRIYLALDGHNNFTHIPGQLMPGDGLPYKVEFEVNYAHEAPQKYAIFIYVAVGYNSVHNLTRVAYYRASLRVGKIQLNGQSYPVALTNEKTDGLYSNLDGTYVRLDLFGNGVIPPPFFADSPFIVDSVPYSITSISRNGEKMTISKAGSGQITGRVVDKITQLPLLSGQVKLTKTNAFCQDMRGNIGLNGHYSLSVLEGRQRGDLIVRANGYVPALMRLDQLDNPQATVTAGQSLHFDFSLALASSITSGHLRLDVGSSYHFLAGTRGDKEDGDFYLDVYYGSLIFSSAGHFQHDIVDLEDTNPGPLAQVIPPDTGYDYYAIPAIVRHTYVARARVGEEGHYIIFRVTEVYQNQYVEIDFYYR